jgi:hypothetical protein
MSENIKTDDFAFRSILNSLKNKIAPNQLSVKNLESITPDILVKLLTDPAGHIFPDNCCLKLATTPVAYLLGECANESI